MELHAKYLFGENRGSEKENRSHTAEVPNFHQFWWKRDHFLKYDFVILFLDNFGVKLREKYPTL